MILTGDIGGTNTRLAIFDKQNMLIEKKFSSKNYQSLEDIALVFLQEQKLHQKLTKACFAVAGPVREGRCVATNLPWIIDQKSLSSSLRIPSVSLLNDLEAKAYGIRMLKKEELYVLHPGDVRQTGNQALIAAGTGLGEAGLYWDGKEHHPFACEGGHVDFAPRNDLEIELLSYLHKKFDHVSYERVVSGPGISLLYRFLVESGKVKESEAVKKEMQENGSPFVISKWAVEHHDAACAQTIDLFLSLYGAESGNLALKMFSLGGFYIGGGIAPYLAKKMQESSFISSFMNKGRFKSLLESIPVYVILNDDASLLGAFYFATS